MQKPQQIVSYMFSDFHVNFRLKSYTVLSEVVLTQPNSERTAHTIKILTMNFTSQNDRFGYLYRQWPQMLGINPDYDLHQTKMARVASCTTLCNRFESQRFGSNAIHTAPLTSLIRWNPGWVSDPSVGSILCGQYPESAVFTLKSHLYWLQDFD